MQAQDQAANEATWRKLLLDGHQQLIMAHRIFRHLPSPPRCKLCHNPFGGIGGKLVGLMGFTPSRKNPNLCAKCCDTLPPGGLEVDVAVLFADVRASTARGEQLTPSAFAALLNRFYQVSTEVLIRHDAIIDKLIGDEVMALFIPGFCGPEYRRRAAEASMALLKAMGYGESAEPWLPLGVGVNSGVAFVGNVGGEGTVDFTALGDMVNTASRMQSNAGTGEVVLSETVYSAVADEFPDAESRTLNLRGREAPVEVRVLRCLQS
ncbi:MAG TPA: adenylate/guanylate cyclase domain-containing protein [Candidatus Binataceae bacterium]|nr:adenylate/guanylate cyclase domain-containing protein [Candidatus Binataceae bacterium]